MSPPLIDVRPEADFLGGHVPGSVNFPLEELPQRTHELPQRRAELRITDSDPARSAMAAEILRTRGHVVSTIALDRLALEESGPSPFRLWRPNPFLIEALARISMETKGKPRKPLKAIDVACGSGRDAVYLALNGYQVRAIDVLPDALARASDLAQRNGVLVECMRHDLERTPSLGDGCYDLVCVFRYLQRSLFSSLNQVVAPGGFVVYETFHEFNLRTGNKPTKPEHLLKTGELANAFAGFQLLIYEDAFEREGRFFSHLLVRRSQT